MPFGYAQRTPYDSTSELNEITFIIRQMTARMNVMKLVKVLAVNNISGLNVGTVDVLPLVSQVDGNNNTQPHGTVSGIKYFRLQGGTSAVVCDPAKNDVGYVVCADRDSTNVKIGQSAAVAPGSFRRNDLQDGIYIGGVANAAPKQFLQFTSTGINIDDINGNTIVMNGSGVFITDHFGNKINLQTSGITATDVHNNNFTFGSSGVTITANSNTNTVTLNSAGINATDKNGNQLQLTSTGWRIIDNNSNQITSSSVGITILDTNNNSIIMASGIVNVSTAAFQVRGTTLTVP